MKFDCDNCGTRYNIADEKVRRKVLKIRCRVCEHVITVRGADLERQAPDAEGDDAPAPLADGWFAAPDGEEIGPMPLERLQGMVEVGEVGVDTLVWCEGMPDWIAVGAVPELVPHLPKASSLDDEATSTFEMHDRIDDSLRRTLLSTPPPRAVRPEPSEPDRRSGIGWDDPPVDERPTVAEPRIGPLVQSPSAGGDTQRRMLVVLIVLAVLVLLGVVMAITWWISQPPGQRPGLSVPATPAAPVAPAVPAAPAPAPAAPAPAPAAPAAAAPAPETLTPEQVQGVIATHKGDIERCRSKHSGALPAEKDVLAFDLRPTGRVSTPRLEGKLAETDFAGCLTAAAREWRFPVFTGQPIPVQYPFELSAKPAE